MRRVLGLLKLLLVGLLVCALLVGAGVAGVFITNPRDEPAYLRYVQKHGDLAGRRAKTAPTHEALIGAGDRACEWLEHREPALWRNDSEHSLSSLPPAYAKTLSKQERGLPEAVVPGAWAHLCPATKALIMPHRPWERG